MPNNARLTYRLLKSGQRFLINYPPLSGINRKAHHDILMGSFDFDFDGRSDLNRH